MSAALTLCVVVPSCYISVTCFQHLNPSATKGFSSCVDCPQRPPRKSKRSSTSLMMMTADTLKSLSSSVWNNVVGSACTYHVGSCSHGRKILWFLLHYHTQLWYSRMMFFTACAGTSYSDSSREREHWRRRKLRVSFQQLMMTVMEELVWRVGVWFLHIHWKSH